MVGLTGATTPPQVREPIQSCPCVIFGPCAVISTRYSPGCSKTTLLPAGWKYPKRFVRPRMTRSSI